MGKSPQRDAPEAADPLPGGYFHWSRDPSMGLFAVLPLWLCYIGLRWQLAPDERNGAELWLLRELSRLGPRAHLVLSASFALLVAVSARSLVRDRKSVV